MEQDQIAAFPLCWPSGWPRTKSTINSRFQQTMYSAASNLRTELQRLGGSEIIVSTSVPLRKDGIPLSKPPVDGDVGAAVYFKRKGRAVCLACDQYNDVGDNIHALAKTIAAMRDIERWGSTDLLDRAFEGFMALPASTKRPYWEVLGISEEATLDEAKSAWRKLSQKHHPDNGGDHDRMSEINTAMDEAKDVWENSLAMAR